MDLWKASSDPEYDREVPCVNCGKPAKPTVSGNNLKCWDCGHLFKEDGSKLVDVQCVCKKCAPEHDPLKGKTKGKKAELDLNDRDEKKETKVKRTKTKKNVKKLLCDSCGEIDFAVVDGYSFGDRLLEGVNFAVTLKGDKYTARPLTKSDENYLDDLNKKKWLKAAADYAEETDILQCSKCKDDVLNPLFDDADAPEPVSAQALNLEEWVLKGKNKPS